MSLLKKSSFIICIFYLGINSSALALKSDNTEKVYIVADSAIYNYKTGVNLFEGHVKVDQGTTHITGDRLITINNEQHQIKEATAYGIKELAHYWTIPNDKDPEIHAHARIIKFYPLQSNVTLEKEVTVVQGENNFHGEIVLYDKANQTITVPAATNGRAVLVYNPDK